MAIRKENLQCDVGNKRVKKVENEDTLVKSPDSLLP